MASAHVKAAQRASVRRSASRRLPDDPRHRWKKGIEMADLAYVLLIIGCFALLTVMLRGLERL
ncbi:MAG: hypothetical protein J2P19_03865 [Pseudonocardia sp.]|nr:hypothetical protein [Pseudonocardia sp.]